MIFADVLDDKTSETETRLPTAQTCSIMVSYGYDWSTTNWYVTYRLCMRIQEAHEVFVGLEQLGKMNIIHHYPNLDCLQWPRPDTKDCWVLVIFPSS